MSGNGPTRPGRRRRRDFQKNDTGHDFRVHVGPGHSAFDGNKTDGVFRIENRSEFLTTLTAENVFNYPLGWLGDNGPRQFSDFMKW